MRKKLVRYREIDKIMFIGKGVSEAAYDRELHCS
jgi:hypothetical protein